MRRKKSAHFSMEGERECLACLGGFGEHGGEQMEAKGKPFLALEAKLKRWSMCVCVCVCMRSSTKKLSIKAWELSHKMN